MDKCYGLQDFYNHFYEENEKEKNKDSKKRKGYVKQNMDSCSFFPFFGTKFAHGIFAVARGDNELLGQVEALRPNSFVFVNEA